MAKARFDKQSARDAGTLLPIVAAILFLPPMTLIFSAPAEIAGIPLILVYLFGAWAMVIAASLFLAVRLDDSGHTPPEREDPVGNSGPADSRAPGSRIPR
jgi:hypothetical protein